jgi:hypothetical protein
VWSAINLTTLDIIQTSDYITLHCGTYVQNILDNHGWSDMCSGKLPMSSDSNHIRSLDTAELPSSDSDRAALEDAHFAIVALLVNSFGL